MKKTITHNGKVFDLEEVKADFKKLFQLSEKGGLTMFTLTYNFSSKDLYRYQNLIKEMKPQLMLQYFKFLFCSMIERKQSDKDMPIFEALEICKKYVTIDPNFRNKFPHNNEVGYRRAYKAFQNKVMLQIEDLIIAVGDPEWCQIFADYIPHADKEALLKVAENAQAQQK